MAGKKALREACLDLWQKGVISTRTMLESQGYSVEIEKAQLEKEQQDGTNDIMKPRDSKVQPSSNGEGKVGRPELDDDERTSDPEAALRGKQPKPSNDEGSMSDGSI